MLHMVIVACPKQNVSKFWCFCNSSAHAIRKDAIRRFPAALQLTLLIRWRSLSRNESCKIRASTIFPDLSRLSELLRLICIHEMKQL